MAKYLLPALVALCLAIAYAAYADPTPIIIDGHPACLCDDGSIRQACYLCP